ncbi:MAG: methionine--tRNA ligase [Patescibacteria group bacterium]
MSDKFYLTTTLPYVNAPPHIGFALEIIQADAIARHERLRGREVFFNTGTDEHGVNIYRRALEEGKEPQAYVDEYAKKFVDLMRALNISEHKFIRTTDAHHMSAAQELWRRSDKNGYIYKAKYRVKYCVGCELEKTESELEDGRCLLHPTKPIEEIEEENYFFKFSAFQDRLLKLYAANPDFVLPEFRFKEIKKFVESGLKDFSVSRLKEKMPWGVPVPGDPSHVMYVWFDALTNYISTLGWPASAKTPADAKALAGKSAGKPDSTGVATDKPSYFEEWWGTKEHPNAVQIAGKDNLRQQSAMWQAMLMAAELPPPKQILIHGFVQSGGQKMSKSLGNVVNPVEFSEKHGADALRYFLLKEIPTFGDGDFTLERFVEVYNADLANGLGNFAARVTTLASKQPLDKSSSRLDPKAETAIGEAHIKLNLAMAKYELDAALLAVRELSAFGDGYVNTTKPWETDNPDALFTLVVILDNIAGMLQPFLPATAGKITSCVSHTDGQIAVQKVGVLFPRI